MGDERGPRRQGAQGQSRDAHGPDGHRPQDGVAVEVTDHQGAGGLQRGRKIDVLGVDDGGCHG
eukprot:5325403-Alexandrium_andersonii.AAC.1